MAKEDSAKKLTPQEEAIGRGIEKWLAGHLRNTAFSQDTGAWNVLQKAIPELTPILVEELK
jgi:phosphodiesterase/alkaline phosphatase D-like protein